MCASCGWILILYMSSFFFKLFVPCIFSTYGIKTNWCHCFNFIRILPDLYMFRAHRPILRRVHTAVHTIGSVSVLLWSCAQSMWPEQYRHWTNGRVNSCVNSPEDGPVGPKHVENRQYINEIKIVTSVGFYSIYWKDARYKRLKTPTFNYLKNRHKGKVFWTSMWPSFSQQIVFKALWTQINTYIGLRVWQVPYTRRKSRKTFGKLPVIYFWI